MDLLPDGADRLASFVVLCPSLGPENTACLVNIIWVFAAVAPWARFPGRRVLWDTALRAGVAFLAATSHRRASSSSRVGRFGAHSAHLSALVVAEALHGLLVQLWVVVDDRHQPSLRDPRRADHPGRGGLPVFGTFLLGPKWVARLWVANWRITAIGCTVSWSA